MGFLSEMAHTIERHKQFDLLGIYGSGLRIAIAIDLKPTKVNSGRLLLRFIRQIIKAILYRSLSSNIALQRAPAVRRYARRARSHPV